MSEPYSQNDIPCANCGHPVKYYHSKKGITADGTMALNIPGVLCGRHCVDDMVDFILGDMVCITELSAEMIASDLLEMQFGTGTKTAVDFFLHLFPTNGEIIDIAAVRLHQEGEKQKAYSILEQGLKDSDDRNRLRLGLAALLGMDDKPQNGLNLINDVPPDTPRYYVIRGNLFRKANQWDEAAACWYYAIESEPLDINSWFNLGYYLLTVKKWYEKAEQHFQNACEAFPDEGRFRAYLGDAIFFQGRNVEALKEYRKAQPMIEGDSQFENILKRMIDQCGG